MDEYESYETEFDEAAAIDMYWFGEDMGEGVLPVVRWKLRKYKDIL